MLDRSDERALADAVLRGDRGACAELVRLHHAAVYRLLFHLTRDAHAAEDLTQETFAAAWAHLGGFNGSAALATWLHRIAYRKFADRRRRPALPGGQGAGEPEQWVDRLPGAAHDPLDDVVAGEQSRRLAEAVDRLDEADRHLIVLHYFQALSFREMAVVLERPAGTVKWRVSQALSRLRELIDEEPDARPRGATQAAAPAPGAGRP